MYLTPSQQLLLQRLQVHGQAAKSITEDGQVLIGTRQGDVLLNTSQVERHLVPERAKDQVDTFIQSALRRQLPEHWLVARTGLRLSLEVTDNLPEAVVRRRFSDRTSLVLVHTDLLEQRISFLTLAHLRAWGVDEQTAWDFATGNMEEMLKLTDVIFQDVSGHSIAILNTPSAFKTALLGLPGLRARIERTLGWPVLAVAPCRDFVYVLRTDALDLLPALSVVVMKEFKNSSAPITTEVLRLEGTTARTLGMFG